MDKTVKVKVPFIAMWPKLKKRVVRNTILLVHDSDNACDVGDKVELAKSRPYSKRKRHIVKQILVKDAAAKFLHENPEYKMTSRNLRQLRDKAKADEAAYKERASIEMLRSATAQTDAARAQQLRQPSSAAPTLNAPAEASNGATVTSTTSKPKSKKQTLTPLLEEGDDDDDTKSSKRK